MKRKVEKMKRFSTLFSTFKAWLKANPRKSTYAKAIIRVHRLNPEATLKQIRSGTALFSNKPWKSLSPGLKRERTLSLEVLRRLRSGQRLARALKSIDLPLNRIISHLGSALRHGKKGWFAAKKDHIEREMTIYENGNIISIVVKDSTDASLIGRYHNAVKKYLRTGDQSVLQPFRNKKIRDVNGRKYRFETNPSKLRDIDDRIEEPEFFDIYDS